MRVSERYLRDLLVLDLILATELGDPSDNERLPDFSPAGEEARAALARRALGWLSEEEAPDRVAAELMRERLETELAMHDAGQHEMAVYVIAPL